MRTAFQFLISRFRFSILFVLLALTACGGAQGGAPLPEGPTTLAYAVSECRQEKGGEAFLTRQVLYVRQGDGQPLPVMEFGEVGPKPNNVFCEFGIARDGNRSVHWWPLQRLNVSRDGSLVVFEVTDGFSEFSQSQVPPGREGIYVVHADGSGLQRLGPASRNPCFTPQGFDPCFLAFSPNGRTVTFTDLDSDMPQLDAPQVFTMDVDTGTRTQLTHLPAASTMGQEASFGAQFLDDETIFFTSFANPPTQNHPNGANPDGVATRFTVKTDGTGLEPVPVIALPGGSIIPNFFITSAEPLAVGIPLPKEGKPVNPPAGFGDVVVELFMYAANPSQVLQLTSFRRSDTYWAKLTANLQRVVFLASADPLGSNPAQHCEVFSIDRLGSTSTLQQLTNIGEGPSANCDFSDDSNPRTCSITQLRIDPVTGWVTFYSSCNPFGTNTYGSQIFTMRPDGTGLRQLTATSGRTEADGTVTVELPGPWAVPARGL